ncbi:ABC transporter substrate-binding protein [Halosimplex salinum]|uniref:ABC transporter substrate-binding protein n=1 Tax=Halosimplex salinum TaxID=1710538 RepID=UPI0013DE25C3|nr:PotD/PotF family extracellular solute-binding protein [Halosimplex salinum]
MDEVDGGRRPRPLSRRRVLKSVGVAAGAAAVGGGHLLSRDSPEMPPRLDAWPPDGGAETVVTADYYDRWSAWAAEAFADRTGITVQHYRSFAWEPSRSLGGREKPPGLLRRAYERVEGLFTEPSVRDEPEGSFDNVVTTTDFVGRAVEDDLLHSLPAADVPSFDRVFDVFRSLPVHRTDGDVFALPVEAQLTPLVYNADHFERPPDSWGALWDGADEGEVLIDTDVVYGHPEIAALYAGEDPRDPDFERLEATLRRQRPKLVDGHDDRDRAPAADVFAAGDAVVGSISLPALYEARFERDVPLEYVVPSEGAILNCRFSAVPTASKRPLAGLQYANWLCRPEVAARRWEMERAVPTVPLDGHAAATVREVLDWADGGEFRLKPHLFGPDGTVREYRRLMDRVQGDEDAA